MADDPNQLGGDLQSRVAAVIHSVAALHAAQEGQGPGQAAANPTPPQGPGQMGQAPQQPANPMMAQQSALMGAPAPQQGQNPYQIPGQPGGPKALGTAAPFAQPYTSPNPQPAPPAQASIGGPGETPLPPGVTAQRQPGRDGFDSVTSYTGNFPAPPQGGQPSPQQVQQDEHLKKLAAPLTQSDVQAAMLQAGFDTSNPAVLRQYGPAYAQMMQKQKAEQLKMTLDLHKAVSQDQVKGAQVQKMQADAELARKRAVMTGNPQDISRAKALAQSATQYMKTHTLEAAQPGGWFYSGTPASPAYAQAEKDAGAAMDTLRGGGDGQPVTLGEDADAEYEDLPSGAQFVGPDGKTRRKP